MIYDNGISAAQMRPALQLPVSHKKSTAILCPFPGTRSLLGGVFGLFVAGYTAIAAINNTISVVRPFLFELPEFLSEWASIRQILCK
jgi:hypothetical protein